MQNQIFYSWQTDTPPELHKVFIRQAIEDAVKNVNEQMVVEDALRVDSGMEETPGSPEVASIMFEKIANSAIFIGDVTLVGAIANAKGTKRTPNPNVLTEMGYAASTLGWERVVCVMNEHFGLKTEQPFDVRNRRFPIDYNLSSKESTDVQKQALVKWLELAISGVLQYDSNLVGKAINRLNVNCLNLMTSYGKGQWFADPNPTVWKTGGYLDSPRFHNAIDRLLDIGMLKTDANPSAGQYAYHWTYLGRSVLDKLNLGPSKEAANEQ